MKIEIISGSPRTASVTHRVALHLKNWLSQNSSHEADIIAMKDWNIPAVQSVWVSPEKAPVEFQPLAERIFNGVSRSDGWYEGLATITSIDSGFVWYHITLYADYPGSGQKVQPRR